jgi:hypothetical protein
MLARPVYVTVIGWLLIVIGVLSLLSTPAVLYLSSTRAWLDTAALPVPVQVLLNLGSALISLVSGYYILRGRNWARLLFTVWSAAESVLSVVDAPATARSGVFLVWIALLLVIIVLLFLPPSNLYFGAADSVPADGEAPSA